MRTGPLRQRLEIQEMIETRNAAQDIVQTWLTVGHRWASVRPLKGEERVNGQRVDSTLSHRVRMHYYPDLTPTHRFKWGSRTLTIDHVINVGERGVMHEVICVEDV